MKVKNKINAKTKFIEKFINEHEEELKRFAEIKEINIEKARKIAKEELQEKIEDEDIEDFEDLEERLLTWQEESYLSFDVKRIDFQECFAYGIILTGFGGPTTWIPVSINLDYLFSYKEIEIDIDHRPDELDYEYDWFRNTHRTKVRVKDLIEFMDIVFIYSYNARFIFRRVLEEKLEELQNAIKEVME